MRLLLILWFAPLALMGVWYGLSANDLNFGTVIFSRPLHDEVMRVYSGMLGVPASDIPGIVGKALVLDSVIVMAIVCWRRWDWVGPQLERLVLPIRDYFSRTRAL